MHESEKSASMLKEEYDSFRSNVPLKKVCCGEGVNNEVAWSFYEVGPKSVRCPLVFLPPVSGGADVYFRQLLALSALGFRVLSVDYPCYWNIQTFLIEFKKFLNAQNFEKVHVFGASLGGYLAQCFAESCFGCQRVASLILCNSFADTTIFDRQQAALMYWALPAVLLKRIVLGGFPKTDDAEIAASINFMIERLDSLNQEQLASRMTMNCSKSKCQTWKISNLPITLIDVFDTSALSSGAKDQMVRLYPEAKRAHFKTGGNFPFLSRSAEVNLHIQIHLQKFQKTPWSAREEDPAT